VRRSLGSTEPRFDGASVRRSLGATEPRSTDAGGGRRELQHGLPPAVRRSPAPWVARRAGAAAAWMAPMAVFTCPMHRLVRVPAWVGSLLRRVGMPHRPVDPRPVQLDSGGSEAPGSGNGAPDRSHGGGPGEARPQGPTSSARGGPPAHPSSPARPRGRDAWRWAIQRGEPLARPTDEPNSQRVMPRPRGRAPPLPWCAESMRRVGLRPPSLLVLSRGRCRGERPPAVWGRVQDPTLVGPSRCAAVVRVQLVWVQLVCSALRCGWQSQANSLPPRPTVSRPGPRCDDAAGAM